MKKRIAVIALCFVLTALLCSCGSYAPVKVNSQRISKGVYAYFTDRAEAEKAEGDSASVTDIADAKLSRYIAVNSRFAESGLSLDAADKKSVSETVDSQWHLYSAYYTGKGVSRQDLYKIELSKAYEKTLMLGYYSADGEKPISEEELKNYFSENFVAFRTVTGFLTTLDENNNAVSMNEQQRQQIAGSFESATNDINENSVSLVDASADMQDVTVTEDIVVISKDNSYPEGFYDKIRELESGRAAAFAIGDYIFCAQRYELLSEEYNLFQKYRTDCLQALKGEEFDSVVGSWAEAYRVEHN